MSTTTEDSLRIGQKRLTQVFRYLEALNNHRNSAKRHIDEQVWRLWLRDLPDHPAIQVTSLADLQASENTDGIDRNTAYALLRVRRPRLTSCPPPPEPLLPWLETGWSLFEPHSEIIRKGKASKPTEFGKLVQVTEAENQIVTQYDVFERRPSDRELLTSAVTEQQKRLGRVPQLVTADAGYYAQTHERAIEEMGVKWVAVPNRSTRSAERKKKEKSRWFKKAQAWRMLAII